MKIQTATSSTRSKKIWLLWLAPLLVLLPLLGLRYQPQEVSIHFDDKYGIAQVFLYPELSKLAMQNNNAVQFNVSITSKLPNAGPTLESYLSYDRATGVLKYSDHGVGFGHGYFWSKLTDDGVNAAAKAEINLTKLPYGEMIRFEQTPQGQLKKHGARFSGRW